MIRGHRRICFSCESGRHVSLFCPVVGFNPFIYSYACETNILWSAVKIFLCLMEVVVCYVVLRMRAHCVPIRYVKLPSLFTARGQYDSLGHGFDLIKLHKTPVHIMMVISVTINN